MPFWDFFGATFLGKAVIKVTLLDCRCVVPVFVTTGPYSSVGLHHYATAWLLTTLSVRG